MTERRLSSWRMAPSLSDPVEYAASTSDDCISGSSHFFISPSNKKGTVQNDGTHRGYITSDEIMSSDFSLKIGTDDVSVLSDKRNVIGE